MSLIKCPMCGKDISPNAIACPNCGEPMKNAQNCNKIYKVQLNGCVQKVKVIKVVREITGLGLKESKDIVDSVPSKVTICNSYDAAQNISRIITSADYAASVDIIECVGNEEICIDHTVQNPNTNIKLIKCPNCNSADTHKISMAGRLASGLTFGLFSSSIGKTWECGSCGYKW